MTRRNASQMDLLGYRPPGPADVLLPEPTITPPEPGSYREVKIEWRAPEGTVMVATDEDELDRMVEQIMETAENAGIVSFLRWRAQGRGLRHALGAVFRLSDYDSSFGEVRSLTVSGSSWVYDEDSYDPVDGWNKPREKEIGFRGITVFATRRRGWGLEVFSAIIGVRGIRKGSDNIWRLRT